MGTAASKAIDLVEAAYDLEVGAADWLPQLLAAGGDLLDTGLGCLGALGTGLQEDRQPVLSQLCTSDGTPTLALSLMAAVQELGTDHVLQRTPEFLESPIIDRLSDLRDERFKEYEVYTRHFQCKDILTIHAHDPDGHGMFVSIPMKKDVSLTRAGKRRWERIAVHITTGNRLRRRLLGDEPVVGVSPSELPMNAEALVDPTRFLVSDAVGDARDGTALATIREAAVRVDRARGKLRRDDPEKAMELWRAMISGRWSLVDWFDTDRRRFVLAKPNAPNLGDPRGLTEQEHQVVTYASRGESQKLIAYRLGLTSQRVSKLLHDVMHKLGVKTQAQLVEKLRGLQDA